MTDEKAEELFQRFVKGWKVISKIGGCALAGVGIFWTVQIMSYNPTFLDAFFSSDTFYLAGFIVMCFMCFNSYRKDFPPNDGKEDHSKADHSKADHSKNEEVSAETSKYQMRPVRDLTI